MEAFIFTCMVSVMILFGGAMVMLIVWALTQEVKTYNRAGCTEAHPSPFIKFICEMSRQRTPHYRGEKLYF